MSEQANNKLLTDVFVEGARKGWDIAVHNTIPNVLMAFVIIHILKVSGALDIIGKYLGFVMLPLGLPGESIAVIMAAFLSWGGSAGVLVALVQGGTLTAPDIAVLIPGMALVQGGTLTAPDIAVLIPGMALVGSTVQYMGRVLGVLGIPGKHYLVLFGICILNAYLAMFVMSIIV